MSRRPRPKRKPRVTADEIASILSVLDSFASGKRAEALTWESLEGLVSRPRRTLIRNDVVFRAYWKAKKACGPIDALRRREITNALEKSLLVRIAQLEAEVESLTSSRNRSDERLLRLIEAVEARGLNIREFVDSAFPKRAAAS